MLVVAQCLSLWIVFLSWPVRTLAVRERSMVQESSMWNPGLFCPAECTCARAIVDCRDRGLSNVPISLPNATLKLFLDGNALQAFNDLGPVPTLEVVTLTRNSLSSLPSDAFRSLPRLKHLDLSANRLSDQLSNDVFHHLVYLEFINISANALQHITDSHFRGLGFLDTLDLSQNTLSQIDKDAFNDLKNLEVLNLSKNKLAHIQQEWFSALGHLRTLDLSHNRIQRIGNVLFYTLTNLRILNLSNNIISLVGTLSFKGLHQVTKLDLSYNNITTLQKSTTRNMEQLLDVDLSYNPLDSFDDAFASSPTIQSLRLDNTHRLRELTINSLRGLSGLTKLHLSHSALATINPEAFSDLVNLQELHLSKSQLRTLSKEVFKKFNFLEYVYLQGNPWHCDCLLHWMLRWLHDHRGHMVHSHETKCQAPQYLQGVPILDALDHQMTCHNASAEPLNIKPDYMLGSDAMLSCSISGYPTPSLTWVTPRNIMLHMSSNTSSVTQHPSIHGPGGDDLDENDLQRLELLSNGSLKVKHVGRTDTGVYRCIASNTLSNSTAQVSLMLNGGFVQDIKYMSIWVGLATSAGFLLLTLVGQFVCWVMVRCGWECPCCTHLGSRKGQQLWRVLENMETYKSQQLERLRDNYNNQVQKIKDNCMQQMEWLRESYSCQVERLRDIRDYGTQQIDKIRDNYYSQVQKVRDYSTSQIDRLRENYIFQRTRIRKFSAHQLLRLRENYKLQQQHLNKILESLNLDNCKANCSRTDSIIFDSPELAIQPAFHSNEGLPVDLVHLHLDYVETGSQISAYYTPNDSGSETSSSTSDKNQTTHWEQRLHGTPTRKKRLRPPVVIKCDMGSSTTDLHLYQCGPASNANTVAPKSVEMKVTVEEDEPNSCATDQQLLPNPNALPEEPRADDDSSKEDPSMPNEHQLALPLQNTDTPGQQLSDYSNHGSQDLNHLASIECHNGVTTGPQENVTETIV